MLARKNLTPEENTILDLLVKSIEDFEDKHYPIPKGTASSMLLHLMEAQDISKESLVQVFGSIENVDKVMNGDSEITSKQAQELENLFHVDASLFLNE
ncbi:type II toxin-antitoxin system HigA family antitoxin [Rivularia sp. PCC 7116]|uniref:helix-turn-helix domain-containing protein n=1 Tax=Rivularia sp. PCC 7116 TaxID=373994 RepID=UPI0002D4421E|nr:transcriptional regulator [Rivularia sp. PCC 7116]